MSLEFRRTRERTRKAAVSDSTQRGQLTKRQRKAGERRTRQDISHKHVTLELCVLVLIYMISRYRCYRWIQLQVCGCSRHVTGRPWPLSPCLQPGGYACVRMHKCKSKYARLNTCACINIVSTYDVCQSMYVCQCIHVCLHVNVCMYICTSMYVCTHVCQCIDAYLCMSTYVCLWLYVNVCMPTYTCMCRCEHVPACK